MQISGMLLAAATLFFRLHTRVFLTLLVALSIAFLSLTGIAHLPAATLPLLVEKAAAPAALPVRAENSEFPRSVIRLFVLLPQLLPPGR